MTHDKANDMPLERASPLHVAIVLPGLGRVQRGAEAAFLELTKQFVADPSLKIELFGTGSAGVDGVPLHTAGFVPRERFENWPRLPILRGPYHYEELSFVMSLAWRRILKPGRFDVLLHCTYPFVNWFAQIHSRRGSPRTVFVTQNGDWMCRADSREYRLFRCDGLICTNPEYLERHRERYRAVLIPNGVDVGVFHPEVPPDSLPTPVGAPVVLMAAAMIPSKCVAEGVEAVAAIPNAFLVVVGDGPERGRVSEAAQRLMPNRHRVLGSVPRERMPGLFRRADAFLHMSRDEPFGIVYLEAAASGLPCVVHDGPVPRWILGDTAVYADTANLSAVTVALRQVLNTEEGRRLGVAAHHRVAANWTWAAAAAQYSAFFHTVAAAPRGGRSC
jgi:glycosyltransferase involved in cell wall biosynthesis